MPIFLHVKVQRVKSMQKLKSPILRPPIWPVVYLISGFDGCNTKKHNPRYRYLAIHVPKTLHESDLLTSISHEFLVRLCREIPAKC